MATRGASSDIKSRFYSREMEKLRYWLQKRPLQRELLQAQSQGDEREFLLRALKFSSVYVTEEELGPPQHLRPSGRGRAGVAGGGARGGPRENEQIGGSSSSTAPLQRIGTTGDDGGGGSGQKRLRRTEAGVESGGKRPEVDEGESKAISTTTKTTVASTKEKDRGDTTTFVPETVQTTSQTRRNQAQEGAGNLQEHGAFRSFGAPEDEAPPRSTTVSSEQRAAPLVSLSSSSLTSARPAPAPNRQLQPPLFVQQANNDDTTVDPSATSTTSTTTTTPATTSTTTVPTYQLSTPTPSTTPPATKYSDVIFPTRFQCRTASCSPYDLYVLYDNKTESDKTKHCRDILNDEMEKFYEAVSATENFRAYPSDVSYASSGVVRIALCSMYENIFNRVRPFGDNQVYQNCEPWTYFNGTLCLDEYRDVRVFTDCLWKSKIFWPETKVGGAKEEIMTYADFVKSKEAKNVFDWLIVWKRHMPTAEMKRAQGFDSLQTFRALCNWIYEISDPIRKSFYMNSADALYMPPDSCYDEGEFPVNPDQCQILLRSDPYNVCPWSEDSGGPEDDKVVCFDGVAGLMERDGYDFCYGMRFGKMQCEPRAPVMCRKPYTCDGQTDHCCVKHMEQCVPDGLPRLCCPSLDFLTQEQRGEVPLRRRPSYYNELIAGQLTTGQPEFVRVTTTTPSSRIEQLKTLQIWIFVGVIFGFGVLLALMRQGWKNNWGQWVKLNFALSTNVKHRIHVMESAEMRVPASGKLGKHHEAYSKIDEEKKYRKPDTYRSGGQGATGGPDGGTGAARGSKRGEKQGSVFDAFNMQNELDREKLEQVEQQCKMEEDPDKLSEAIKEAKRLNGDAQTIRQGEDRLLKMQMTEVYRRPKTSTSTYGGSIVPYLYNNARHFLLTYFDSGVRRSFRSSSTAPFL